MSFQITDDILDFTATEKELGKPAGSDLIQGNITLPVLYAMENPELKNKIKTVHENMDPTELIPIIQMIKDSGAIERSTKMSDLYLDKALQVLNELPENKAKKTLRDIAKFIGRRKY
jgi:heptaprenyl diphosphate synthase